jgi:hypothetical protein
MRRGVQTLLLALMILPPRVAERIMLDSSTSAHSTASRSVDASEAVGTARGSTDDGRLRRQSQWPCGTGGCTSGRSAQTVVPLPFIRIDPRCVTPHSPAASLCPTAAPSQRSHWSGRSGSRRSTLHCTAHKHSHEQQAHTCTRTHIGVHTLRSAFRRASLSAAAHQSGRSAAAASRARSGSRVCISTRRHVSQRHDRWRSCNARHAGGCSGKRDGKILRRAKQQVQTNTVPAAAVAVPACPLPLCPPHFPVCFTHVRALHLCPMCVLCRHGETRTKAAQDLRALVSRPSRRN